MRPSRVTLVFSTTNSPAPEQAMVPRCCRCQSVIEPSSAEYWHIGDTTMRLGSVMPPRSSGVKSSGRRDRDFSFLEGFSQGGRKHRGPRLVAVDAQRVRGHGNALARQAGDVTFL